MEERKLTEKQKRFIDYYIETGNQTEAARLSGYKQPHVQGNRLLENVRDLVDAKLEAKDNERIASQDEVLCFFTAVMRNEEVEDVVVVEGIGKGYSRARVIQKTLSAKDRLEAAKSLAKRYGLFSDKSNHEESTAADDWIAALTNGDDDG